MQSITSALSVFSKISQLSNIMGTDWLFCFIAQGLDVRLARMVPKAVVKMCRCFHTCWMTGDNNYASNCSLHVTLAVNKTLKISQVGRPSVVSKQNK